jgi:hypothetical protein
MLIPFHVDVTFCFPFVLLHFFFFKFLDFVSKDFVYFAMHSFRMFKIIWDLFVLKYNRSHILIHLNVLCDFFFHFLRAI